MHFEKEGGERVKRNEVEEEEEEEEKKKKKGKLTSKCTTKLKDTRERNNA